MTNKTIFEIITIDDPAIDHSTSNLLEYIKTRDISNLSFKGSPVKFIVNRISTDMILRLREFSKGDKTTYQYLIFLASCQQYSIGEEVVNATLIDNTKLANDEWIENIRSEFGINALEELITVSFMIQSASKRNPNFSK